MNVAADLQPIGPVSVKTKRPDHTGRELKRGAALNATAMLASNFRAVFTLLIARLLGPVALGIFSVAWATADLVSKLGIVGHSLRELKQLAIAGAVGFIFELRVLSLLCSRQSWPRC